MSSVNHAWNGKAFATLYLKMQDGMRWWHLANKGIF